MPELETIDKKLIVFSDRNALQIATVKASTGTALDIRLMYPDNVNQEWKPTKKGAFMIVSKDQVEQIVDAIKSMTNNFE